MDLLGITEAAEILCRDRTMVHRYVREGRLAVEHKLPGLRGAYVFQRAVVERLAAELAAERMAKS